MKNILREKREILLSVHSEYEVTEYEEDTTAGSI